MGRIAWALGLFALLGAGAWLIAFRADTGTVSATIQSAAFAKPDIATLQALATRSCRCARSAPVEKDKQACWSEFERQAAPFHPAEYSTMCDPISPSGYCFGEDRRDCVVKEYSGIPRTSLCSAEEAGIAMAAFEDAMRRADAGDEAANPDRAFVEAARALARGERLAAASGKAGCAG